MIHILQKTLLILNDKERRRFYVLILLNVIISIADIASLALLVFLISIYTTSSIYTGFLIKYKWVLGNNPLPLILLFVSLFILKNILGYAVYIGQYNYVYKVASRISKASLLKYLRGSYGDYVDIDSSVHIRRILQQPIEFCHYVLAGIQQVITESLLSLFAIIVILFFNASLFLLLAIVLAPPVIIIAWYTKRKLKQARANVKTSNEKTLQHLQEALSGYIESNVNDKHHFFTDRYTNYQQKMFQYLADVQTTQGVPSRIIEAFAVLGVFILIVVNKVSGNSSMVEIINIGAFMAAAYKIIPGIVRISNISGQVKTYEYTTDDLLQNNIAGAHETARIYLPIKSVAFHDVSFKQKDNTILQHFDLSLSSGDFVGITGPSGKGKTTIINLLIGFLSPDNGDILINSIIMNTAQRQQYQERIAYVQQRPFLINDTICTNITLTTNDYNQQKLSEIINIAGLGEFINDHSDRLNKAITENGKNISGGQRQRIAFARALYKDADLIILDEPFSELDSCSEQRILNHMQELSKQGKIIILITHNKEHLHYCNKTYQIG